MYKESVTYYPCQYQTNLADRFGSKNRMLLIRRRNARSFATNPIWLIIDKIRNRTLTAAENDSCANPGQFGCIHSPPILFILSFYVLRHRVQVDLYDVHYVHCHNANVISSHCYAHHVIMLLLQ